MKTLTQSIETCPRCGRTHALPLVFVLLDAPIVKDEVAYLYLAQCTWRLAPILARINDVGHLETEPAINAEHKEPVEYANLLD